MKKQQSKRKMASGGPVSAKTEKRTTPDQTMNDKQAVTKTEKNDRPAPTESGFLSRPDKKQMAPKVAHSVSKIATSRQAGEPPYKTHIEGQEKHDMITNLVSTHAADQDNLDEPMNLEADKDMSAPNMHEYMADHFAKGGAIGEDMQPEEEAGMEHHDSIASAIMAKRAKMHAHIDSGALDEDDAADHMYADGGEVDIMDNGHEETADAEYTKRNHAALKENYDMPIEDATQPADSNEHGDTREDDESDKHDMISKIRSQIMKRKQSR